MRLLLLLASLTLAGLAQAGSVYRWVDKDGVVHYDDTNTVAERVTRDIFEKDLPDRPDWDGIIPADLTREVERRCRHSQERLTQYSAAPVIYGRDPSGNVYRLSDTQARLMIAEIRSEVDRYCQPGAARLIYTERRTQAREEARQRAAANP